ncbi:MAG TPA: hypothetical protein VH370_12555 [Humisphaera sp.]|nr:hypothetical protein [Humisphaera sp.]
MHVGVEESNNFEALLPQLRCPLLVIRLPVSVRVTIKFDNQLA